MNYIRSTLSIADALLQDFHQGFRLIKRSKGVAAGVIVSMALGVGATASIFSFVDFLSICPLPVPETNRVVRLVNSTPTDQVGRFSYPEYQEYVERTRSFTGLASYQNISIGLSRDGKEQPRVALGSVVSGNFFSTLQVKPAIGRGILPEDDAPGRSGDVAVISNAEWRRDFAEAPDVVGRKISVNGRAVTIIGVAPEEFVGAQPVIEPEIYFPRMFLAVPDNRIDASVLTSWTDREVNLLARLKPGITVAQARDDVSRIANEMALEHPQSNKDIKAVVLTQFGYRQASAPSNGMFAVLLLAVVFLVLGIACVNVSNLLLSMAPIRAREMAVRAAMGASRARLFRQLFAESFIVSAVGILVGLAIASWCASFLSSIQIGSDLSLRFNIHVDQRVVIFAFIVGGISAFVSGAVPAWRCSRGDVNSVLKSSDPRNQPQKMRGRQILAAAQVAITAVVLVFSALFLKELRLAATQSPGFRVDHVLTIALDPSIAGYKRERALTFYRQLVERVRDLSSVRAAAIAEDKPFGMMNNGSTTVEIDGWDTAGKQAAVDIRSNLVSDGYFEALNIPIIRGRAFDQRDSLKTPQSVIINEAMAKQYWPNRDPIGARLVIKENGGGPAEVIGVARNAKYASMSDPPSLPFLYRTYDQGNETVAVLLIQTSGPPEGIVPAVRTIISGLDSHVPMFDVRTMEDHFREYGLLEPRITAQVFTAIGVTGLILGILGLYGVIAYSVAQRGHEIGIRIAVGASGPRILKMVLLQGLSWSGFAALLGTVLALLLSRMTNGIVSHVNPHDPAIYAGVFLLLLVVTGAASYIPARRASMVDPNVTLRT